MNYFKLFVIITTGISLLISFTKGLPTHLNQTGEYEPYVFSQNFEKEETFPVKDWVSNLKKENCKVAYSFDLNSNTEGKSSLKIDIDSKGLDDPNKKWYYYLQVPLNLIPNLEGNLSFSIDVKMDKKSTKNIQIGLNLRYLPITTGIHSFNQLDSTTQSDKWVTIKHSNLKNFTLSHADSFVSKIYGAKLSSFGREVSNIAILIRGRGAQKYQISLDNLKINGNIRNVDEFVKKYNRGWSEYIKQVRMDINKKEQLYNNLLKKVSGKSFSSSQEEYKGKIKKLFKEINTSIKDNKTLKKSKVELLDSYLKRFKALVEGRASIKLYKMPSMKYHRLTGYNTPPLDILKSFDLQMTPNEYKSIAFIIEPINSWGIHNIEFTDFIGENSSFSKDNLDLFVAKIWYQSGLYDTLKTGKFLTQELLLKDDSLVKVDLKKKRIILG